MKKYILEDSLKAEHDKSTKYAKFLLIQSIYKIRPCHKLGHVMLQVFLTLFKVVPFSLSLLVICLFRSHTILFLTALEVKCNSKLLYQNILYQLKNYSQTKTYFTVWAKKGCQSCRVVSPGGASSVPLPQGRLRLSGLP